MVCLFVCAGFGEPDIRVEAVRAEVPSEVRRVISALIKEFEEIAPAVKVEHQMDPAEVKAFHTRLAEAKAAAAVGKWVKAYEALTSGQVWHFVKYQLPTYEMTRRWLISGPFPVTPVPGLAGAAAELEKEVLERNLSSMGYRGLDGKTCPWRLVEFRSFIGGEDRIPLASVLPRSGRATIYLTSFVNFRGKITREEREEREVTFRLKGTAIEAVRNWGEPIYEASGITAQADQDQVEFKAKVRAGWNWILIKLQVGPSDRFLGFRAYDAEGKPIIQGKPGEAPGELAMWAPRDPGDVRQKLRKLRDVMRAIDQWLVAYEQKNGVYPLRGDFGEWVKEQGFRHPFEEGSFRYGSGHYDRKAKRWTPSDSFRLWVSCSLPFDGAWKNYDPREGLYSPGQACIFRGKEWVEWGVWFVSQGNRHALQKKMAKQGWKYLSNIDGWFPEGTQ